MTECRGCRALEFISNGIKRGVIMDVKLAEPRFNCALNNKIILVEDKPFCKGECKDKTTRIGRLK